MDAAGGPFDTEFHYAAQNSGYGEPYRIISELFVQYLSKVGITAKAFEEDYNSTFLLQSSQGKTNGLTWIPQTRTDPFAYYQTQYLNPTHPVYGRWVDDQLAGEVKQIQALTDPTQLKSQIKNLQNELGPRCTLCRCSMGRRHVHRISAVRPECAGLPVARPGRTGREPAALLVQQVMR